MILPLFLRVRGHSNHFEDVCTECSKFAFLDEIKHRFSFIRSSRFATFASACCLDGGEGCFVDGWSVCPHAGLGGDPFVDAGGDLVGFVCGEWFGELGVEFVYVVADSEVEAVGVSEVVAEFSVGPGSGGFED